MLKSYDSEKEQITPVPRDVDATLLVSAAKALVQLLLMVAIVACSVMGMNWLLASKPEKPSRPPFQTVYPVETVTVSTGNYTPKVTIYGQVISERSIDLRALVSGEIVWANEALQAGAKIEAGDPLVKIDKFDYEGALSEANANLAQTDAVILEIKARLEAERSQLAAANQQLELAQRDLDRANQLLGSGSMTAKQVEERELGLSVRQQAVSQRESNISIETARLGQQEAARARLQWKVSQAQKSVADTEMKAPFTGVVRASTAEVGKFAGPNDIIVSMYSLDQLAARFTLTDAQFGRISTDSSPLIGRSIEAYWSVGETEYRIDGTVTRIGADIVSERGGVEIIASLNSADIPAQIRPGAFLEVRLADRVYKNAVRIPEDSIYDSDTIYLVKDDKLSSRKITVLAYDDGMAIIAGPVGNGDVVLATRLSVVSDGLPVKPSANELGIGAGAGVDQTSAINPPALTRSD